MYKKYFTKFYIVFIFIVPFLFACLEDEEVGLKPGIVRILLSSDPTDTSIEILGDVIPVSDDDSLGLNIFQGKAIASDDNFAILYETVHDWNQQQSVYNVLERENGAYKKHIIFESLVPPGNYSGVSLGIEGTAMAIGPYLIPIVLPDTALSVMTFDTNYEVVEKRVTEIHLQISPFRSMDRYLDSYRFSRISEITDVEYLSGDEYDRVVAGLPYLINPNNPFGG